MVFMHYLLSVAKHGLHKQKIGLTVMKENVRAVHLYKKIGFAVVREDVTFRGINDSYEMHLEL